MDYFFSIKDKYNYIHSIDNCIMSFYLTINIKNAIKFIQLNGSSRDTYWERLDCSRCSRYSYYQNHIHYDDGIYIKIGHYDVYLEDKKKYEVLPIIQFEINPNKHYQKDSFKEILNFIELYCKDGNLDKYDYAIDMPIPISAIKLFDSRKEKGLYKGTVYRGQRNKNGYLKIYDKAKENKDNDSVLTRIEHTCCKRDNLSLENLYIVDSNISADLSGLNASRRALVECIYRLRENGLEYEDIIDSMDRATKSRLMPFLYGGYQKYEYDLTILDRLLEHISSVFRLSYTDSQGFMVVTDEDLPFE